MQWTIGKKLYFGFGMLIVLMVVVVSSVYVKTQDVNSIQTRVIETRMPTVIAGTELQNGINHSLAALRGYMILDSDKWKVERAAAWENIDRNIVKMQSLASEWSQQENVDRLNQFIAVMEEFRAAQQIVEDIANTPEEQPAMVILFEEAAPRATGMLAAITEMINQEKELESTPERKALLATMADSRGSLAVGLASIRAYLLSGDEKFVDTFRAKWKINTARFETLTQSVAMMNVEQSEAFANYGKARGEFAPLPEQMFSIRGSSGWNVANELLGSKAAPKAVKAVAILNEMIASQEESLTSDTVGLVEASLFLEHVVLVMGVASTVLGCFIAIGLTRTITKPINRMIQAIEDGEGDLTMRVDQSRSDEIGKLGEWFNKFVENMQLVILQMRDSSQAVASASTQIAASADEMAGGLQEQETQTQQVAAAVEELSQSVTEVAAKSSDATIASEQSQHLAEEGGSVVCSTVAEMEGIATEVNASAQTINALGKQSEKIGEIIAVINDIADQTNLLALNAAIEAARAGEHGRGFAVVADEVRKLAERTTQATEEVSSSIRGIQGETISAVTQIEAGSERVGKGVELANQAGSSLETIVTGCKSVQGMVQDIAAAATQQSTASDEIARAIASISTVTRQSSESAGQASEAAGDLAHQAEQLMELVGQFKVE
jgi:methyl-accepting chemotaxis protein